MCCTIIRRYINTKYETKTQTPNKKYDRHSDTIKSHRKLVFLKPSFKNKVEEADLISIGKAFHNFGARTEKAQSPQIFRIDLGTTNNSC